MSKAFRPTKIISGGQTGVDRAGLDAAIELGLPHGGSVPFGRRTEAGPLEARYEVTELPSEAYEDRTLMNILDSNATVLITDGTVGAGSALTKRLARRHDRPLLHLDFQSETDQEVVTRLQAWLQRERPNVLNVAGSRESSSPGIHARTQTLLLRVLAAVDPLHR